MDSCSERQDKIDFDEFYRAPSAQRGLSRTIVGSGKGSGLNLGNGYNSMPRLPGRGKKSRDRRSTTTDMLAEFKRDSRSYGGLSSTVIGTSMAGTRYSTRSARKTRDRGLSSTVIGQPSGGMGAPAFGRTTMGARIGRSTSGFSRQTTKD